MFSNDTWNTRTTVASIVKLNSSLHEAPNPGRGYCFLCSSPFTFHSLPKENRKDFAAFRPKSYEQALGNIFKFLMKWCTRWILKTWCRVGSHFAILRCRFYFILFHQMLCHNKSPHTDHRGVLKLWIFRPISPISLKDLLKGIIKSRNISGIVQTIFPK